jgi:hypothetical protein
MVHHLRPGGQFRVVTDASDYAVGGLLLQEQAGEFKLVAVMSKRFQGSQRHWGATDKEAAAVYFALHRWRPLLLGSGFVGVFTDHRNLAYVATNPSARVVRWQMAVQDVDYGISHIPGVTNPADYLSRAMMPGERKEEVAGTTAIRYGLVAQTRSAAAAAAPSPPPPAAVAIEDDPPPAATPPPLLPLPPPWWTGNPPLWLVVRVIPSRWMSR